MFHIRALRNIYTYVIGILMYAKHFYQSAFVCLLHNCKLCKLPLAVLFSRIPPQDDLQNFRQNAPSQRPHVVVSAALQTLNSVQMLTFFPLLLFCQNPLPLHFTTLHITRRTSKTPWEPLQRYIFRSPLPAPHYSNKRTVSLCTPSVPLVT